MRTARTRPRQASIRRTSCSGASSRSATTSARPARIWKAGSFVAADGKTAQIPDAWAAAWKCFYKSIWTDHTAVDCAQFQNTDFNPNGYPFFTGKVAMSTNYLWSLYGVADAGDDWNMAATPAYQGQTTAAFNADTFRILKATKNPDAAFTVLTYLLDNRGPPQAVRRHAGRGVASRTPSCESLAGRLHPDHRLERSPRHGVDYADIPNFESSCPAYNETCRPDPEVSGRSGSRPPGLDLDAEIDDLQDRDAGHLGQGELIR